MEVPSDNTSTRLRHVPEVVCCFKDISKKNQMEEEIKAKFLEHDVVHQNHIQLFTDGSAVINALDLV